MNQSPSLKRQDAAVKPQDQQQPAQFDQPSRTPAVSIRDTQEALLVDVDLPGVKADQLQLSINQGVLILNAPVSPIAREGFQLLHQEYDEAGFRRAFTLPDDVDTGAISAQARNGVVTITLPKSKEALPRRIAVTSG